MQNLHHGQQEFPHVNVSFRRNPTQCSSFTRLCQHTEWPILGFANSSHRYGKFQQDIPTLCCAIYSAAILEMVFIDFGPTYQVYIDVLQNEFTSVMMLILTKVG